MLDTNTIPARSLQTSYNAIIEAVKTKQKAVILTTNAKPQAALVSLEDLEQLQHAKAINSSLKLLQLAHQNKEELQKLPEDLRAQADSIVYTWYN